MPDRRLVLSSRRRSPRPHHRSSTRPSSSRVMAPPPTAFGVVGLGLRRHRRGGRGLRRHGRRRRRRARPTCSCARARRGPCSSSCWRPTARPSDNFGLSVSISGDTVVVGSAPATTRRAAPDSGSAYVFVRSGTTWTQQQQLLPADVRGGAELRLLGVGLRRHRRGRRTPGQHRVRVRRGLRVRVRALRGASGASSRSSWLPTARRTTSSGSPSRSPATRVVVGAFFDDALQLNQGSAYVFVRSGTTWSLPDRSSSPPMAYSTTSSASRCRSPATPRSWARSSPTHLRAWTRERPTCSCARARSGPSSRSSIGSDTDGGRPVRGLGLGRRDDDGRGRRPATTTPGLARTRGRPTSSDASGRLDRAPDAAGPGRRGPRQLRAAVSVAGDTVVIGASFDDTPGGADAGSAHVFRGIVPVELERFTVE